MGPDKPGHILIPLPHEVREDEVGRPGVGTGCKTEGDPNRIRGCLEPAEGDLVELLCRAHPGLIGATHRLGIQR